MDNQRDRESGPHRHPHGQNRLAVIPTAEKLSADPRFVGRGVTIAFLDAGFYPHPDIANRVTAFHDVTGAETDLRAIAAPEGHHWHGTQTTVAAAGDGSLSDGIYAGLAKQAELVLVKVSDRGRIPDDHIERGLRWILEHRERLNIRVLNISLGGDADGPSNASAINQLAGAAVRAGIAVTVAAGNDDARHSIPPASAPDVITVGGYSDENGRERDAYELYHSSYGVTSDGLVKPELVAPAMYVAAPLLPATTPYTVAEALSALAAAPDYRFPGLLAQLAGAAGLDPALGQVDLPAARAAVDDLLARRRVVATHYQHVDGTSFAAPIVASVVAQMIEANPRLTPAVIKHILISTATRLAGFPAIRQGYGAVCAASAVTAALNEEHYLDAAEYGPPRADGRRLQFSFHDHAARAVALVGDFNGWDTAATPFAPHGQGLWRADIGCPAAGRYRYKILVDGRRWTEDPSHGFKEDDGYGGFNSILAVARPES